MIYSLWYRATTIDAWLVDPPPNICKGSALGTWCLGMVRIMQQLYALVVQHWQLFTFLVAHWGKPPSCSRWMLMMVRDLNYLSTRISERLLVFHTGDFGVLCAVLSLFVRKSVEIRWCLWMVDSKSLITRKSWNFPTSNTLHGCVKVMLHF